MEQTFFKETIRCSYCYTRCFSSFDKVNVYELLSKLIEKGVSFDIMRAVELVY